MTDPEYVSIVDMDGNAVKPVTDLAALNMTTTNGIAVVQTNGGTIGIRAGYIESCFCTNIMEAGVGPAIPSSSSST